MLNVEVWFAGIESGHGELSRRREAIELVGGLVPFARALREVLHLGSTPQQGAEAWTCTCR